MSKKSLEFVAQLDCTSQYNEDSKVHVGYIPVLRLFTQAKSEERLKRALTNLAKTFIVCCWERGILERELKARGMQKTEGKGMPARGSTEGQFIALHEYEHEFRVEVPLKLPVEGSTFACLQ